MGVEVAHRPERAVHPGTADGRELAGEEQDPAHGRPMLAAPIGQA
jgi:hypothetical protein